MLTRKLIQHILVFVCSIGVTKVILWVIDNYRTNEVVEITVKLILILINSIVGAVLLTLSVFLTSAFFKCAITVGCMAGCRPKSTNLSI